MRLSNVPDGRLQLLADQYRSIASKHIDPTIFEELIDRRAAMSADRSLEAALAYEYASSLIDTNCGIAEGPVLEGDGEWIDLDDTPIQETGSLQRPLEEAVRYLEGRGLIARHAEHSNWICILDEDEPLGAATRTVDHTHPQHQHPEEGE